MSTEVVEVNPLTEVERAERALLKMRQVDCPVRHHFAPGLYVREITMPAGAIVIGHEHRTEHLNFVLRGKAVVLIDGVRHEITAPYVTKSLPGSRKIALVLEDMVWATVHPTEETNLEKLEELLITKSQSFLEHSMREAKLLEAETRKTEGGSQ